MNEQEKLKAFLSLIEAGVVVNTAFVKGDTTDTFTHQLLQITCGDYTTYSQPEPLDIPLVPASATQLNQTVN